ncbi:nucleoside diphosphate kinase, mitochondrial isoform X3 [Acanthopagrus latus]|uniref:nucleoside diphosphate kinase, mitochondrial isoform X3 n=1 Tax=Acanthopagrus latus TaxID=8177 RepID=UPI00187BFB8C|nr:nucleoside diphosphate kinase, mitochondrial isoform X3 [Acanthopagrus latus]
MVTMQRCFFNRILQQFCSGTRVTIGYHGAAGRRSVSTGVPGVRERTLIAIKPDGVQRRLVGQIIQRFEQRGFKLVGLKMLQVWEGYKVIESSRMMVGHTNPAEAQAGTVRGDFSIHVSRNVVHASDSVEGAQREIQLWFKGKELLNWDCCDHASTFEL